MFLSLIAILFAFPVLARELKSFIFVSENTPSDLLSEFSVLTNTSSDIPIYRFSSSLLPAIRSSQPHAIFDFTYSLLYGASLRNFAVDNQILLFSSQEFWEFDSEWVFYLHPPPSTEAQAIRSFIRYLNWTDFHLLTSESERSKAMYSDLSSSIYQLISNSADQEVFDLYASRFIKPSGNWKAVILGEEKVASNILWGLEKARIYKERCGFVVSSKGWKGSKKLGAIGIVEEGLEDAQSEEEYEFKSILKAISTMESLTEDLKGPVMSNEILAKRLREKNGKNVVSETYSIVNYKEDSRVVGKIERGSIETWEEIIFPGNVTYMNNSPPKVLVSANTGSDIENQDLLAGAFLVSLGLQPMVSLVNNDPSILPTFELELHEIDCGYRVFEYTHISNCMKKHYDKIGAAHLASIEPSVVTSYLELFKEVKIEVPHITMAYNDAELYDKNLYPEVLITLSDPVFYYVLLPYVLRSFRWSNVILVSTEDFDPYYISVFTANARILNINILNQVNSTYIPNLRTETYNEDVKDFIEFIHKSKCRIIIFYAGFVASYYFIEALYDFGYRRGELVFIFRDRASNSLETTSEFKIDREKVLELISGSISLVVDQFVGEYGKELEKQIAAMVDPYPTTYSCFRIDGLMLAVRTIDLMINIGRDYEDFRDIMYFMRGIRFTGCTGKVSIDSGGNGISDVIYAITNFYEEGGIEYEDIAGSYTLGVIVPLNISKPIVWPSGNTEVPRDMIEETKCGFPDVLVKENTKSREVSGVTTGSLFLAIFILTSLAWRQINPQKIEFLNEKREVMFEDGVIVYLPLIETAQFIGLGPDFYNANFALAFVSSLATLDFDRIIDFEFDSFWKILEFALAVAAVWCFSLFFTLMFPDYSKPRFLTDFFEVVGLKMIQVFSGAGFVGINFILFRIFKCQNGIAEDLSRSFLYNDCKTFCWEGTHLYFLIAICGLIVVFNVFGILSRQIYDGLMDYVKVKVFPFYAFAKGIFQLALVVLNLNLKDEHPGIFSAVYCALFAVWLLLLMRVDCYNYHRLNCWVRVFGSGVLTHLLLMVGYTLLPIPDLVILILQLVIIVGCLGTGFYLQVKKFPSMLYRKKGRNFDKLLRFALTRRVNAKELTEQKLDYVDKKD